MVNVRREGINREIIFNPGVQYVNLRKLINLLRHRSEQRALRYLLRRLGFNNYQNLYESGEINVLRVLGSQWNVNDIVVDCGANCGLYSAAVLTNTKAKVIAVEPNPLALRELYQLQATWSDRLIVLPVAIGPTEGEAVLYQPKDGTSFSTVSNRYRRSAEEIFSSTELTVEMTKLDSIIARARSLRGWEGPVSLLKLDIEGYEYEALVGSREVIERENIPAIQLEFNIHQLILGRTFLDFARLLEKYKPYRILSHKRGLLAIDAFGWQANIYSFANYVFLSLPSSQGNEKTLS